MTSGDGDGNASDKDDHYNDVSGEQNESEGYDDDVENQGEDFNVINVNLKRQSWRTTGLGFSDYSEQYLFLVSLSLAS